MLNIKYYIILITLKNFLLFYFSFSKPPFDFLKQLFPFAF